MLTCETENKQLIFQCLKENIVSWLYCITGLQKASSYISEHFFETVVKSLNTAKGCILKKVAYTHTLQQACFGTLSYAWYQARYLYISDVQKLD